MPSSLSFTATKLLRDKLLARNLTPYSVPGVYTPTNNQPATGPLIQSDYNVINSPDALISANPFANNLAKNNEFSPFGGFDLDIDGLINELQPVSPNQGPYGPYPPFTTALQLYSATFQRRQYVRNRYTPEFGFIRYYDIGDIIQVQRNATYWEPPSFRPSSYSPFSILLQEDPSGDNGLVSQDSDLAKIAAENLKAAYQYRIDQNVRTQTIGRVNILNGLQDPVNLSQIIAGRRPIIDRDWQITTGGGNIISQGMDIVQRIAGFTFPFSPIPGDYFELDNAQRDFNSTQSLVQAEDNLAARLLGGLFGLGGSRPKSPSQVFLDYTGSGQRAQLSMNLDMNRYRPQYNTGGTGIISALGNAILGGFAAQQSQGLYYVGSPEREPTYLTSPPGQIPLNEFQQQVLAPVYGPDILAKDFEGPDQDFAFGLAGKAFMNDGSLDGGFTWVNQKWAPNSGRYQKPGGDYAGTDPDFTLIEGQFSDSRSIDYTLRPGSILDNTQRLIDSVPNTGARFAHVGNAIDQTSKVFFDGYKEITKGSQIIRYSDGQANVGIEYCRVFTKDTPYYTFNDLQKSEGNIRKFSYSVMDSTYNLNIVPYSSEDSTNIINAGGTLGRSVKKYLFSIENLAWRTGYRPGYRVQDLPDCEKGPNGGRIMWFPPYDLEFSEDTRPTFQDFNFIGRPEPVYTYKNTSRGGTLKWKIIVDHPSILNLIVNKVLANEGDREKVDSIVDSFFAGCKKYDLYELAKIYNTIPLTELQAWQEVVNNPNVTQEQFSDAVRNLQTQEGVAPTGGQSGGGTSTEAVSSDVLNGFKDLAFYFENDIPKGDPQTTVSIPYQDTYSQYVALSGTTYKDNAQNPTSVELFFTDTIGPNYSRIQQLGAEIGKILSQKQASKIVLNLRGSASSPQKEAYNQKLSQRRISSVENFFKTYTFPGDVKLGEYIAAGQIVFNPTALGELTTVSPVVVDGGFKTGPFRCTTNQTYPNNWYSVDAMACRAVVITDIIVEPIAPQPEPQNVAVNVTLAERGQQLQPIKPGSDIPESIQPTQYLYKGASKKLLRYLLSECDYFQVLKQDNPFLYDSIKEKIKYFQPSFHSMTPEGLNARLTFLQQCMRPGDTIPTINNNGQKVYNDAINTAFGAPPVLVLRVGDFYNTKIIPTNLNFTYEKLYDMNPEGIGFQPMICNVTMSFNFIGGSGLANPVDTLQNALSFNYYANTEMYDERAEATEDTTRLDKEIVDAIKRNPPNAGVSNTSTNITTDGGNTIGVQVVSGATASGDTGTIAYGDFMNKLVEQSSSYFSGTLNFFNNVLTNYNSGVLALLNYSSGGNQGYNNGLWDGSSVNIYGKPLKYQNYVDKAFQELTKTIDDGDIPIFSTTQLSTNYISPSQKKLFKKNYKDYLTSWRGNFLEFLTNEIGTIVKLQQDYVFNVDRMNFVLNGPSPTIGYDGKMNQQNIATIFSLSGTSETIGGVTIANTYTNLGVDYNLLGNDVEDFLVNLNTANLYVGTNFNPNTAIFTPPSSSKADWTGKSNGYKLEYMLMSRALLEVSNKTNFLNALKQGLEPKTQDVIQFYYDGLGNNSSYFQQWKKLKDDDADVLTSFRASSVGKKYENYKPSFNTTQKRITLFSKDVSAPQTIKTTLQNIYSNKNDTGQVNPYNGKRRFN